MRSVADSAGPGSAPGLTPPGMLTRSTRPGPARRVTIPPKPTETDGSPDGRAGTSVLLNGLKVLETFSIEEPLLGVTEIAGRVGMHKSSVSRILAVLEQVHYVERDPESGRFRLGLGVIGLAGPLLAETVAGAPKKLMAPTPRATARAKTTGLKCSFLKFNDVLLFC